MHSSWTIRRVIEISTKALKEFDNVKREKIHVLEMASREDRIIKDFVKDMLYLLMFGKE